MALEERQTRAAQKQAWVKNTPECERLLRPLFKPQKEGGIAVCNEKESRSHVPHMLGPAILLAGLFL
jgi:hypothetical protein